MSKNKNTKKALEKLKVKRAKYAAGGYGYTGRRRSDSVPYIPAEKERNTYQNGEDSQPTGGDSVDNTNGSYGNPPSGGPQDAVTYTGLDGNEYSTNAELQAANVAFLAAQAEDNKVETVSTGTAGSVTSPAPSGKPPTGIKVTGPQAYVRQMTAQAIDPLTGITKSSSGQGTGYGVQKLADAKDATSTKVSSGYLKAEQGKASQATVSGVDSEADQ